MDPLALIAAALSLFTLTALYAAFTLNRRLNALRSNCSIRNERGHMVRYTSASEQVRAKAEAAV